MDHHLGMKVTSIPFKKTGSSGVNPWSIAEIELAKNGAAIAVKAADKIKAEIQIRLMSYLLFEACTNSSEIILAASDTLRIAVSSTLKPVSSMP